MEWFTRNAAALTPLVAIVFAAAGYLLRRWLTGERHREESDSIERAVQLKRLLDAEGMTLEAAVRLRDQLRSPRGPTLMAEARAIAEQQAITSEEQAAQAIAADPEIADREIGFEETTVGMGFKLSAELEGVEAQLRYAIADLAHVSTASRSDALDHAQVAWEGYRDTEAEFAALLFEGGTGAPLLGTARMVELTERRLSDIRACRAEIESLMGR
jgi:uncharacterized protein YecT (DUF1311 family)